MAIPIGIQCVYTYMYGSSERVVLAVLNSALCQGILFIMSISVQFEVHSVSHITFLTVFHL